MFDFSYVDSGAISIRLLVDLYCAAMVNLQVVNMYFFYLVYFLPYLIRYLNNLDWTANVAQVFFLLLTTT